MQRKVFLATRSSVVEEGKRPPHTELVQASVSPALAETHTKTFYRQAAAAAKQQKVFAKVLDVVAIDDDEGKPARNMFHQPATLIKNQSFMRGLATIRKLQQTQSHFQRRESEPTEGERVSAK